MLVVVAQLTGHAAHRDAIRAGLADLAATSRRDAGCLSYAFTVDLEDTDRYFSIETWTTQAALDAHMAAPHLAALLEKAGEWFSAPPIIDTHQVV